VQPTKSAKFPQRPDDRASPAVQAHGDGVGPDPEVKGHLAQGDLLQVDPPHHVRILHLDDDQRGLEALAAQPSDLVFVLGIRGGISRQPGAHPRFGGPPPRVVGQPRLEDAPEP
jgi:hypothetical protein